MSKTHFIIFSKLCHLLVIREGEESQEDSSNIRSVENFLRDQMLILRHFKLFFSFHVNRSWANSKTQKLDKQDEQPISWAEGEISTKNWKNEHGFIWWDFHAGSWRNMFQSILRYLSWYSDENVFFEIHGEWVSLMEFDERNVLWSFVKMCFELRKQVKMDENLSFHT